MGPTLFEQLFDRAKPVEGSSFEHLGRSLVIVDGIVRDLAVKDAAQAQTRDVFGFKWSKRDTYESEAVRSATGLWLKQRYGDLLGLLSVPREQKARVLDAGCGAAHTASLLFCDAWNRIEYVGADISTAVELAAANVATRTSSCAFLQADLMTLPFRDHSFDLVLSEGVLHHTPSTRDALMATARLVKQGGLYAIYVYAKKSPVREFTDDYVRSCISDLDPQEAWNQLMSLTKFGHALGKLDLVVEVPEDVKVLGIPKGPINLQRLFYWHICKMFYRSEFSLDEMNHVNFDWFCPKYCHRQTPEEVTEWCEAAGLNIERMQVEEAGITVVARRPDVSKKSK